MQRAGKYRFKPRVRGRRGHLGEVNFDGESGGIDVMTQHPRNVPQVTISNLWIILAQLRDLLGSEICFKPRPWVGKRECSQCNLPGALIVQFPNSNKFIDL